MKKQDPGMAANQEEVVEVLEERSSSSLQIFTSERLHVMFVETNLECLVLMLPNVSSRIIKPEVANNNQAMKSVC